MTAQHPLPPLLAVADNGAMEAEQGLTAEPRNRKRR